MVKDPNWRKKSRREYHPLHWLNSKKYPEKHTRSNQLVYHCQRRPIKAKTPRRKIHCIFKSLRKKAGQNKRMLKWNQISSINLDVWLSKTYI